MIASQQLVPQQTYAVTQTTGIDLTPLINMMIPLMTLMMVMSILMPMMKTMSKGFGGD
jgi:hypothetical protein